MEREEVQGGMYGGGNVKANGVTVVGIRCRGGGGKQGMFFVGPRGVSQRPVVKSRSVVLVRVAVVVQQQQWQWQSKQLPSMQGNWFTARSPRRPSHRGSL